MKAFTLAALILAATSANAAEATDNKEVSELKQTIAEQKQEIKELKAQLNKAEPASGGENVANESKSPAENNKLIKNKFQYNKE